jgi:uncharacterized membrane protein
MDRTRHTVLDWAEQGAEFTASLPSVLKSAGALPGGMAWRQFISLFLLSLGTLLLAAGVIFFLAYNWDDLGRYAQFALVEALIVVALVPVAWLGLGRIAAQVSLFAAAVFLGGLLALIGQTYQTGADTFELFATWSVFILPWVLAARFPPLWILWLALANVAVTLYYETFLGMFGVMFGPERLLWVLFFMNTAALLVWDGLAWRGIRWLRARWAARIIATASGGMITTLALFAVLDDGHARAAPMGMWLAWLAGAYYIYRRLIPDLYVLAGGVLSIIIVVTALLVRFFARTGMDDISFLLIGLAVIGMSALGGWWLRKLASELRRKAEDVP